MSSMFDIKYSQWGNRFLLITERNKWLKALTIFAKGPIVDSDSVLNTSLYYLLAEVLVCQQNGLQSLFSVKLSDNSKIVTAFYYLYNRSTIQKHKLNNRATQVK